MSVTEKNEFRLVWVDVKFSDTFKTYLKVLFTILLIV